MNPEEAVSTALESEKQIASRLSLEKKVGGARLLCIMARCSLYIETKPATKPKTLYH